MSFINLKEKKNEILFEVTGTRDVMNGGLIFSISNDEITHKILIPHEKKDWLINLEAHLSFLREKLTEKYDIVFAIAAVEEMRETFEEMKNNIIGSEDIKIHSKMLNIPRKTKDTKSDTLLKALDFYSKYIERKEEKKEEKYKEYYRYQDTTINLNIDYTAEVYTDPEIEGGYVFELSVGKDSTLIHLYKGSETNNEMLEAIFVIFTNRLKSKGVIEIDKSDFIKAKEFFLKMYKLLLQ